MSVYFMYCNESATTGKELAEMLAPFGVESGQSPDEKYELLIRWGTQKKIPYKPGKVINQLTGISNASDKLKSLALMKAAGVRVPEVYQDVHTVQTPALGREVHHTGGKDITLCLQRSDVLASGSAYWVQYVPVNEEYRVHVYRDQPIKISQKVLSDSEKHTKNWVRNLDNGYTFKQPSTKPKASHIGMAVDAVNSLGLDMGAVDLIVSDDGNAYVLEVNTAPGLMTDTSQQAYVDRFKAEIEALS